MLRQLLSSRAISTVRKYVLHYRSFRAYFKSKGTVFTLPCDSILVSEYLSHLHSAKNSYSVLASVFSALKWVHDIIPHSPLGNPVDTAFSRNIVESGKRLFSRPVMKKELVSPDMIYRICLTFAHSNSNLN